MTPKTNMQVEMILSNLTSITLVFVLIYSNKNIGLYVWIYVFPNIGLIHYMIFVWIYNFWPLKYFTLFPHGEQMKRSRLSTEEHVLPVLSFFF